MLKSRPVDQISEKLIRERDEKQDAMDDAAQKKLMSGNRARLARDIERAKRKDEAEKVKPKRKPKSKRLAKLAEEAAAFLGKDSVPSMRRGRRRAREKMIKTQEREAKRDKDIGL